jgi:hypothetical protein
LVGHASNTRTRALFARVTEFSSGGPIEWATAQGPGAALRWPGVRVCTAGRRRRPSFPYGGTGGGLGPSSTPAHAAPCYGHSTESARVPRFSKRNEGGSECSSVSLSDSVAPHKSTSSSLAYRYFSFRTNQPAVLFYQNKPAPAISHQPTEQATSWPSVPSADKFIYLASRDLSAATGSITTLHYINF